MSYLALRPLASLVLVSLSLAACSEASKAQPPGDAGAGGGGSGGSMAAGGSAGAGGDVTLSSSGSGGSGTGSTGGFDACATSTQDAALVPVNMFIAVDKSGSMAFDQKWTNVKAAFSAFFQDPATAELSVALRLFPQGKCSAPDCSVAACSQPDVDIGPLSDAAQVKALVGELSSVTPGGNTPLNTALAGATAWAVQYAGQAPAGSKEVVILVTDGQPNGCIDNLTTISDKAKNAYATAGVLTFAVGLVGSDQSTMDLIAAAGHTGKGFFIGNGNAEADLLAALHTIQTTSASCVYAMPKAAAGQIIDPQHVNVTYLPSGAMTPETLSQVSNAASCGTSGGWYYDDPLKPASINLCASTCQGVKGDTSAKIQIVLGCATKTQ